jgi:hypothetical protein
MKIEMGKRYRTRDGRDAKILAIDVRANTGKDSVVAAVRDYEGFDKIWTFQANGRFVPDGERPFDLIEIPYRAVRTFSVEGPETNVKTYLKECDNYKSYWENLHKVKVTVESSTEF